MLLASLMFLLTLSLTPDSLRAKATTAAARSPCRVSRLAPIAVQDLEVATLRYLGTFAAGSQRTAVTSTLVVTPHPAGGWAVVERAQLPRGVAVDSARLEARSLVPRERTIDQGPVHIALEFASTEARGTIARRGTSQPIAVPLCGPLVGDGTGAYLVIGHLPLAYGYRASIQHLDIQRATTTNEELAVLACEHITVGAGTFDAWKVGLSEDGEINETMIWVDAVSHVPLKFAVSQGPVVITMELTDSDPVVPWSSHPPAQSRCPSLD